MVLIRTVIVTKCTCVQHKGNSTETNKKQQNYRVRVKNNVRDKEREREKVSKIEREKEGEREERDMRQKKRERTRKKQLSCVPRETQVRTGVRETALVLSSDKRSGRRYPMSTAHDSRTFESERWKQHSITAIP